MRRSREVAVGILSARRLLIVFNLGKTIAYSQIQSFFRGAHLDANLHVPARQDGCSTDACAFSLRQLSARRCSPVCSPAQRRAATRFSSVRASPTALLASLTPTPRVERPSSAHRPHGRRRARRARRATAASVRFALSRSICGKACTPRRRRSSATRTRTRTSTRSCS